MFIVILGKICNLFYTFCRFEKQDGVVLMATTGNLKQIDEALQRPGRMDRVFHLQRPTQAEREKILHMAAKETMDSELIDFVDWRKVIAESVSYLICSHTKAIVKVDKFPLWVGNMLPYDMPSYLFLNPFLVICTLHFNILCLQVAEKTGLLRPIELKLVPASLEGSAFRSKFLDTDELLSYCSWFAVRIN